MTTSETGSVKLELRSLSKSYGAVDAVKALNLSLPEGQLLALLGPSGCGKTTTLRMVAGLEKPTGGEIIVDGAVLANARMSLEPEVRKLGMVFQSYALWPHMTVFDNIAYGLRRARRSREETRKRVDEVLSLVGMSSYGGRPATNLSGGQQQRVALARALATSPKILLFDEPLSNLDAVLRESMRFEIRSLQRQAGITAIYVTHSQEEALAMADIVGVMNAGELHQLAPPEVLYSRPINRFVAGFVGLANLIQAKLLDARNGYLVVEVAGRRFPVELGPQLHGTEFVQGSTVSIAVRPESIALSLAASSEAAQDDAQIFVGTVQSVSFSGNLFDYFVYVEELGETLRVQEQPPRVAEAGDTVSLAIGVADFVLLRD